MKCRYFSSKTVCVRRRLGLKVSFMVVVWLDSQEIALLTHRILFSHVTGTAWVAQSVASAFCLLGKSEVSRLIRGRGPSGENGSHRELVRVAMCPNLFIQMNGLVIWDVFILELSVVWLTSKSSWRRSEWHPEWLCRVDMSTGCSRTPMPQTCGTSKAFLWSRYECWQRVEQRLSATASFSCMFRAWDCAPIENFQPTTLASPASLFKIKRGIQ